MARRLLRSSTAHCSRAATCMSGPICTRFKLKGDTSTWPANASWNSMMSMSLRVRLFLLSNCHSKKSAIAYFNYLQASKPGSCFCREVAQTKGHEICLFREFARQLHVLKLRMACASRLPKSWAPQKKLYAEVRIMMYVCMLMNTSILVHSICT